ncbi:MAG: 16S rRNA (uracil(1498)-N(3))-methyltransferase [Flavobacteriales bacterium]
MQLFYNPILTKNSKEVSFQKEESRHIAKVLRKKEGAVLMLTNGLGYFFRAELISSHPKKCIAKVLDFEKKKPNSYHLHLAVAPTKLNERYEWFLEKATEIGLSQITPIICEHSERKIVKQERFQKKIESAAKQSLKAYFPKLNEAISFKEFLKQQQKNKDIHLIAHCENTTKKSLKETIQAKNNYTILIGPEGDFSSTEIKTATDNGFLPVSLGNNRLRTETAAIVACHSLAFVNEN